MRKDIIKTYDNLSKSLMSRIEQEYADRRYSLASFWSEYIKGRYGENVTIIRSRNDEVLRAEFWQPDYLNKASLLIRFDCIGYHIELYGIPLQEEENRLAIYSSADISKLSASIDMRLAQIDKFYKFETNEEEQEKLATYSEREDLEEFYESIRDVYI